MKIADLKDPKAQLIQQYLQQERVGQAADRTSGAPSLPEEKVDLSAAAKDARSIRELVSQLPEVREERVEELRRQIETGTYHVDGEKIDRIADRMAGESLLDIFV